MTELSCKIEPNEVVEAYKKVGAKPKQEIYVEYGYAFDPSEPLSHERRELYCCGLSAVAIARGTDPSDIMNFASATLKTALNMEDDEFSNFVAGFDEAYNADDPIERTWTDSYDCGRAAWRAVVEAGLVEEKS